MEADDRRPRLRRIEGGEGIAFHHPCHACGSPNAPFGEGVSLLKSKPGVWSCWLHWPGRAAVEARRAQALRAIEGDAF